MVSRCVRWQDRPFGQLRPAAISLLFTIARQIETGDRFLAAGQVTRETP